jgi:heme exporter protein D
VVQFFAMGGYGAYVWSAFGLTLVVLVGLFLQSLWLGRRREAELAVLRQRLREARPRPARPLTPRREPASAGIDKVRG